MNIREQALEQEPTTKNDLGVDCIGRQEVLRLLANSIGKTNTYLQTAVLKMSSVTPQEPKKGHWILDESDNSIECSLCGCKLWANDIMDGEAHFCPNCGAKMVEPQESEG